jgi:hypothetical protein
MTPGAPHLAMLPAYGRVLIWMFMCLFMVAIPPTILAVGYFMGTDCMEKCPAGYDVGPDADYDYGNNHSPNATMAAEARTKCGCGLAVFVSGGLTAGVLLILLSMQGQVETHLTTSIKENEEAQLMKNEVNPFDEEGELMGG